MTRVRDIFDFSFLNSQSSNQHLDKRVFFNETEIIRQKDISQANEGQRSSENLLRNDNQDLNSEKKSNFEDDEENSDNPYREYYLYQKLNHNPIDEDIEGETLDRNNDFYQQQSKDDSYEENGDSHRLVSATNKENESWREQLEEESYKEQAEKIFQAHLSTYLREPWLNEKDSQTEADNRDFQIKLQEHFKHQGSDDHKSYEEQLQDKTKLYNYIEELTLNNAVQEYPISFNNNAYNEPSIKTIFNQILRDKMHPLPLNKISIFLDDIDQKIPMKFSTNAKSLIDLLWTFYQFGSVNFELQSSNFFSDKIKHQILLLNILHGIGLVEKLSNYHFRWIGRVEPERDDLRSKDGQALYANFLWMVVVDLGRFSLLHMKSILDPVYNYKDVYMVIRIFVFLKLVKKTEKQSYVSLIQRNEEVEIYLEKKAMRENNKKECIQRKQEEYEFYDSKKYISNTLETVEDKGQHPKVLFENQSHLETPVGKKLKVEDSVAISVPNQDNEYRFDARAFANCMDVLTRWIFKKKARYYYKQLNLIQEREMLEFEVWVETNLRNGSKKKILYMTIIEDYDPPNVKMMKSTFNSLAIIFFEEESERWLCKPKNRLDPQREDYIRKRIPFLIEGFRSPLKFHLLKLE